MDLEMDLTSMSKKDIDALGNKDLEVILRRAQYPGRSKLKGKLELLDAVVKVRDQQRRAAKRQVTKSTKRGAIKSEAKAARQKVKIELEKLDDDLQLARAQVADLESRRDDVMRTLLDISSDREIN
jgi:hypothetical protein